MPGTGTRNLSMVQIGGREHSCALRIGSWPPCRRLRCRTKQSFFGYTEKQPLFLRGWPCRKAALARCDPENNDRGKQTVFECCHPLDTGQSVRIRGASRDQEPS